MAYGFNADKSKYNLDTETIDLSSYLTNASGTLYAHKTGNVVELYGGLEFDVIDIPSYSQTGTIPSEWLSNAIPAELRPSFGYVDCSVILDSDQASSPFDSGIYIGINRTTGQLYIYTLHNILKSKDYFCGTVGGFHIVYTV